MLPEVGLKKNSLSLIELLVQHLQAIHSQYRYITYVQIITASMIHTYILYGKRVVWLRPPLVTQVNTTKYGVNSQSLSKARERMMMMTEEEKRVEYQQENKIIPIHYRDRIC